MEGLRRSRARAWVARLNGTRHLLPAAGPGTPDRDDRPPHLPKRLATSKTLWCPGGWLPPGFVAVVTMKSVGPGTFTVDVVAVTVGAIRSSSVSIWKRPFTSSF